MSTIIPQYDTDPMDDATRRPGYIASIDDMMREEAQKDHEKFELRQLQAMQQRPPVNIGGVDAGGNSITST